MTSIKFLFFYIMNVGLYVILVALMCQYILSFHTFTAHSWMKRSETAISAATTEPTVEIAGYDIIVPFLSEHVQPSDQILFVGAKTDLSVQLCAQGYGTVNTAFMTVIDSDAAKLAELRALAESNPETSKHLASGKLTFQQIDLTAMPDVCKQSTFDAVIDYGGLDSLVSCGDDAGALRCIDHLQDAVRLGNILVCLSTLEKEVFCAPFDQRWGWVQELDGDPGEISAWYRGKTNIAASKSDFSQLGLKMYVYTNTDNC
jgi:hypothetical protein